MTLKQVYNSLHKAYGPQHWWPGETPFEVMVGAILTQNTAWANVERAIDNLKANNALSAETILKTHSKRLASWLRPSGYFNVKAKRLKNFCHWYQAQGGVQKLKDWDTKALRHGLLGVNGVGAETADGLVWGQVANCEFHPPILLTVTPTVLGCKSKYLPVSRWL